MSQTEPTAIAVPMPIELAPGNRGVVRAAAPVADVVAAQAEYHQLCGALLDKGDYQRIGSKDFPKKSAWRKLAVAFNVSVALVDRDYERDDNGRIIRAEVIARATAPNGRTMDGLGACDLFEKCCPGGAEGCPIRATKHRHCRPNCPGTVHFSNASHDLPATAATRATNRACADLFGMGEVSAEEIGSGHAQFDDGTDAPAAATAAAAPGERVCGTCGKALGSLPVERRSGIYYHKDCGVRPAKPQEAKSAPEGTETPDKAVSPAPAPEGGAGEPLPAYMLAIIEEVKAMENIAVLGELDEAGLDCEGDDATVRARLVEHRVANAPDGAAF